MTSELSFVRLIRTRAGTTAPFPATLQSVEQAIDCVQELPPAKLKQAPWAGVSAALWRALDARHDRALLTAASLALCQALAAEGWLDDTPLS